MPEQISEVLSLIHVLAAYARHLSETLEHRAIGRGFATIAQFFGTATVSVISAHLRRGLMRLTALEAMLLRRAERGRDLVQLQRRTQVSRAAKRTPSPVVQTSGDSAGAPGAPMPATKPEDSPASLDGIVTPVTRRQTPTPPPLTLETLPSMAQIEAEVRRRSVGQNVVAICCDLGVAPTLCAGPFWNEIFMAIWRYRGAVSKIVLGMLQRKKQLDFELWRHPHLTLPDTTREGARQELGFFIGEQQVDPPRPQPDDASPAMPAAAAADLATRITPPVGPAHEAVSKAAATGPP